MEKGFGYYLKWMGIGLLLFIAVLIGILQAWMSGALDVYTYGPNTISIDAKNSRWHQSQNSVVAEPGSIIKLVVRNRDKDIQHNIVIPSKEIESDVIEYGAMTVIGLEVPESGVLEYSCSFHPPMNSSFEIINPDKQY